MFRNTTTSEFVSCREEAFARVAFANELFVFVAELVPKGMERFIVGAMDNVAEPEEIVRRFFNVGVIRTHVAWCRLLPP